MTDTRAAKDALRGRMRTLRARIPADDREQAAERLANALLDHPLLRDTAPGAVLVPVGHRSEIGTDALAARLDANGWDLVRPRSDPERTHIDAVPWPLDQPLVDGFAGIPEPPPEAPTIDPEALALILVPGLAFARDGHRLGTGMGFFDRFLAPIRGGAAGPVVLGIGYALQLLAAVPHEPHDVALDGLQLEEHAVVASQAGAPAST